MYISRKIQKPFTIIAAVDEEGGIGKSGKIPWICPEDMKFFRNLTTQTSQIGTQNAVIMGRCTWESLPASFQPLPNRLNVVITSSSEVSEMISTQFALNVVAFRSLTEAHNYLNERGDIEKQFIIGGSQLYNEAKMCNWSSTMYLTTIPGTYQCDRFLRDIPSYWTKTGEDKRETCTVTTYHNYYTRHLEEQYIYQMRELSHRQPIVGRNGPVHSKFQWSWTTDLADGLPLFSTRRSFWKGICIELLFFIRGDTNSKHLESHGINIWKGNTSLEFLESRGLRGPNRLPEILEDYDEGDMGPMYGWVWRHYGAEYRGMDVDYTGQGFDQLADVLDKLINDPHNRRIMLTTYDPSKVKVSVLAPCHGIITQFYVREEGSSVKYLDMYTYQRSADMFLGVNFNIPSHATLQTIIAQAVGMKPGRFYYGFGDNHVYDNHREALSTLLERTPNDTFPKLEIQKKRSEPESELALVSNRAEGALSWIESLEYDDFKLLDYKPQKRIHAEMVA